MGSMLCMWRPEDNSVESGLTSHLCLGFWGSVPDCQACVTSVLPTVLPSGPFNYSLPVLKSDLNIQQLVCTHSYPYLVRCVVLVNSTALSGL